MGIGGYNNMKLFKGLICALVLILACLGASSCSSGKTNDREYNINEIQGTYEASGYQNGTIYDYFLEINGTSAKAWVESYTFEGEHAGVPHTKRDLFSGKIELTEKNIKIDSHTGYIIDGNITIGEITYCK